MLKVLYPLADNVLCRAKLFGDALNTEVAVHAAAKELFRSGYLIRQKGSYAAIGTMQVHSVRCRALHGRAPQRVSRRSNGQGYQPGILSGGVHVQTEQPS